MKLLFAYTGKAVLEAGQPFPFALTASWINAGNSPFLVYQNSANAMMANGEEFYTNIGYCYVFAHAFDIAKKLSSDEVLTWGWRYNGTFSSTSTLALSGLATNNPRVEYPVVTWADGGSGDTTTVRDLFIECTLDPVARTVTGYINGKKTRTLPLTAATTLDEINLGFLWALSNNSSWKNMNHFYAGVFKKSEGPTILTAWECETLPELSNELRDGDGGLTRNTILDVWKTVEFKLPTTPLEAVSADMNLINPQAYSTLSTDLSDGTTSSPMVISGVGPNSLAGEFGNDTNGRPVLGLSPPKQATKLTLKLKAAGPQE